MQLFASLDILEERLASRRYLGDTPSCTRCMAGVLWALTSTATPWLRACVRRWAAPGPRHLWPCLGSVCGECGERAAIMHRVPPGDTEQPTWLDIRLFHTLVRFDPVYIVYFKTNAKVPLPSPGSSVEPAHLLTDLYPQPQRASPPPSPPSLLPLHVVRS